MRPRTRSMAPILLVVLGLGAAACDAAAAPETTERPAGTTTLPNSTTTEPRPITTANPAGTTTTSTAGDVTDQADGSGCSPGPGDLPDGRWFGYAVSTDAETMDFDLACWFTGDAAAAAAAADGEESPPPNDYYVRNDNETTRTIAVADDTEVAWYPSVGDPSTEATIGYFEWLTSAPQRGVTPGLWIEVQGGQVTSISEQYVP